MHTMSVAVVVVSVGVSICRSISSEYARYRLQMRVCTLKQNCHSLLCKERCALNRMVGMFS